MLNPDLEAALRPARRRALLLAPLPVDVGLLRVDQTWPVRRHWFRMQADEEREHALSSMRTSSTGVAACRSGAIEAPATGLRLGVGAFERALQPSAT